MSYNCTASARFLTAGLILLLGLSLPAEAAGWRSGARNNNYTTPFAGWRGTGLGVVSGWIDWKNGWSGMYSYASGTQPRALRAKSANVSFGHGLFPKGGSLSACASGEYDGEQREVARRLAANGAGDAEIRLGWEQWKSCFTRIAKAMKAAAPKLRIGWFMAKKGRVDVRTIYPADAPITNIGVSHYDDEQARFGDETYLGGPWGLRAWVNFARSKGKKFAIGEWGVGRRGDNPHYIQNMHDFLQWAGDSVAHEAYFNTSEYQLYPVKNLPKSSDLYRRLF
jgi:hypothetical protein